MKTKCILIFLSLITFYVSFCFCESTASNSTIGVNGTEVDDPKASSYGAVGPRDFIKNILLEIARGTRQVTLIGGATADIYCIFKDVANIDKLLENFAFSIARVVGNAIGFPLGEIIWKLWKQIESALTRIGESLGTAVGSPIGALLKRIFQQTPLGNILKGILGRGAPQDRVRTGFSRGTLLIRRLSRLLVYLGRSMVINSNRIARRVVRSLVRRYSLRRLVYIVRSSTSVTNGRFGVGEGRYRCRGRGCGGRNRRRNCRGCENDEYDGSYTVEIGDRDDYEKPEINEGNVREYLERSIANSIRRRGRAMMAGGEQQIGRGVSKQISEYIRKSFPQCIIPGDSNRENTVNIYDIVKQ